MSIFIKETVRVALIQNRISQGEKEDNWRRALLLFEQAMAQDPQLVVFPEAFISGVNFIILRQMAEPIPDGLACRTLQELAQQHAVHLVAGVLELGTDGKIYDTAVLFDPAGRLLAKYRRRFLWRGERNYVNAGDTPAVVDTALGKIGLLVGYDICFPEACATFLRADVDIAVCCASVFSRLNFNAERLALSRAMDHHCYFVYANAIGFHQFANMTYTGGSGIFADPYFLQVQLSRPTEDDLGCLAKCGTDEEWCTADLHITELAEARASRLPFKGDEDFTLSRHRAESLSQR
ncbi:MAG: carbon-nitrogen hydrolase family protein [Acidobacteria bacterium]|nr:carbon-nitrogen hydrolase family protein [Acidobacteriota bacterium]